MSFRRGALRLTEEPHATKRKMETRHHDAVMVRSDELRAKRRDPPQPPERDAIDHVLREPRGRPRRICTTGWGKSY